MRQQNVKIPFVFRVGIVLLCTLLITSHMMGGLYARYSTSVTGTASATVAKISYKFDPDLTNGEWFLSSHPLDTNDVPANCDVIAFEETFTLINDGDVAYEYNLALTITYEDQELADYKLTSISNFVYVASTESTTMFETDKFYYYVGEGTALQVADSPTLTGTLGVGEQATYRILYFARITAKFNQQNELGFSITCTQKD